MEMGVEWELDNLFSSKKNNNLHFIQKQNDKNDDMCRTMHRHLCQKYLNFHSNRKFPIYYCTAQIFI